MRRGSRYDKEHDVYNAVNLLFFMCLSLPTGLGVYWTASALFQWIQQLMFHAYYNHADMDKIIEKSREKAAKKKKQKKDLLCTRGCLGHPQQSSRRRAAISQRAQM